ncbi:MAG: hypothetical protein COV72_05250 [Candidatus Omnitrophica bacterium CG11_big_fil_rev_8_21_14_0_20_42_13]|uniref:NTP pyrophosphohydrolase MazG-like domain-containing protein n=1 Tax=Candidatus Ghiorseimicrobium undicola TaxID=1974746 RepID=A0A2H0LX97_9BACT|nr:MAG: hypothetical protein COV72_05250 [Candidatus Omnitrophica bacterium CG11_big_fil_rev_8_21_14_0_20_42_13]
MKKQTKFSELKNIFEILHGPDGCLWDKEQTHKTLIPYLRQEARELISAINDNDYAQMKEELGDLLIQVMFHSQIASKKGKFNIEDVLEVLIAKLKRRHPHVFSGVKVKSSREIIKNWNKIKIQEKAGTQSLKTNYF